MNTHPDTQPTHTHTYPAVAAAGTRTPPSPRAPTLRAQPPKPGPLLPLSPVSACCLCCFCLPRPATTTLMMVMMVVAPCNRCTQRASLLPQTRALASVCLCVSVRARVCVHVYEDEDEVCVRRLLLVFKTGGRWVALPCRNALCHSPAPACVSVPSAAAAAAAACAQARSRHVRHAQRQTLWVVGSRRVWKARRNRGWGGVHSKAHRRGGGDRRRRKGEASHHHRCRFNDDGKLGCAVGVYGGVFPHPPIIDQPTHGNGPNG